MSKNSLTLEESICIKMLRKIILETKDLYCPHDDEFLLRFVRAKNCIVDAAFESVKSYYRLRKIYPELRLQLSPIAVKKQFEQQIFTVLPNPDLKGPRVMLCKSRNWDLNQFSLDDILLGGYLITEEMISYDDGQLNGVAMIFDHGGLTFSQLRKIAGQLTVKQFKKLFGFYQGAFPAKFKGFHIVNHPRVFDMIFILARPFMSDKLKHRLHEHGYNVTKLHSFFSPDTLPESLGGTMAEDECVDSDYMKRFYEREEYYKGMAKYGYRTSNSGDKK